MTAAVAQNCKHQMEIYFWLFNISFFRIEGDHQSLDEQVDKRISEGDQMRNEITAEKLTFVEEKHRHKTPNKGTRPISLDAE